MYWNKNNGAFACKCIYRKNENNEFYAEHYVSHATEGRFIQHFDVLIAKRKTAVVFVCILCLKEIFDKIRTLLHLPKEIENVCLSFCYCLYKIYSLFYDMNALDNFSTKAIVNSRRRNICNQCMVFLMTSIEAYLMPFLPFFVWKPIAWILTNFVKNSKKFSVRTNRKDWPQNKEYCLVGEHLCHQLTQILSMKSVCI